ncbi:glycosyltransferase [Taibaiella lutea]|uniref:Glycosyltransferase n=1 Tax=Taibaiella lutea TaxID=2608001 RepID=A0A5M6CV58_9BACT|nr:glycosyltransferase [Taibaiella lutea]KAA5536885.1 glycosyltransferase [Taibaiella lutea]
MQYLFYYEFWVYFFCFVCIIQIVFLFILKFNKKQFNNPQPLNNPIPVSIIICAKNEAQNLQQFLPFVLEQDYPKDLSEVIVVNDQSVDNSKEILEALVEKYPQLHILNIPVETIKTLPGKKFALSKGIEAARFERLLLTDADCKPSSDQWLRKISQISNLKPQICLGYGAYEAKFGLLNKFIRWETVNTCMQYASYTAIGLPYMGVGRNLSYDKSLLKDLDKDIAFQEVYKHTPSGDDDLLICKIATKENTSVCLDKDAFTISVPQSTWKDWWKQKTRHSSTGKYYPEKVKSLLGLYAISHSLYWFLGIILISWSLKSGTFLLQSKIWNLAVFLFLLRLFLYWLNAAKWYRQLNEKKILLFYPLGDLGWAIYNVLLSPYIFWKNKQSWK